MSCPVWCRLPDSRAVTPHVSHLLLQEVGQDPVWGNCCGSGVDCDEDSSTIDGLDEACQRHDLCYDRSELHRAV